MLELAEGKRDAWCEGGERTNATMSLFGIGRREWREQVSGKRKVITSVFLRKRAYSKEYGSEMSRKQSKQLNVLVSSAIVNQQCVFG